MYKPNNIFFIGSKNSNKNDKVILSVFTKEETTDINQNKDSHNIIIDSKNENLDYFFTVHEIIRNSIYNNKDIIVQGISISSSVVIAYLMIENKWKYEEAYNYLKNKKSGIELNIEMIQQLKRLEYKIIH